MGAPALLKGWLLPSPRSVDIHTGALSRLCGHPRAGARPRAKESLTQRAKVWVEGKGEQMLAALGGVGIIGILVIVLIVAVILYVVRRS